MALKKTIIGWLDKQIKKTDNEVDDFLIEALHKWVQPYVIVPFAAFVATQTFPTVQAIDTAAKAAFLAMLTWRVIRSTEMTIHFAMDHYVLGETQEADNLRHNAHKGLRVLLYSAGGIFILDNCGLNISSLVAGFGIGGLAIALAAQAILGDAIASITMFADRPFLVGDCISVNGHTGIVKRIGFKTTRIQSVTGEMIIFPNSTVSGATIKNYRRAEFLNKSVEVGIDVTTPDEVVRAFPEMIMNALSDKEGFLPSEVYFREFGPSALVFEVRFTVQSNVATQVRKSIGNVNTLLNETCKANKINLPFPTKVVVQRQ